MPAMLMSWKSVISRAVGISLPHPASGRKTAAETNMALAELANGGMITYQHSTVAGDTAKPRWEVVGSAGYVIAYAGTATEPGTFFGAKHGSPSLEPLAVPPEYAHGVNVEADFIAAIRGEREPNRAITRFNEARRLLEFGEVWKKSVERGCWVDL